jgi:hypothetical protein
MRSTFPAVLPNFRLVRAPTCAVVRANKVMYSNLDSTDLAGLQCESGWRAQDNRTLN